MSVSRVDHRTPTKDRRRRVSVPRSSDRFMVGGGSVPSSSMLCRVEPFNGFALTRLPGQAQDLVLRNLPGIKGGRLGFERNGFAVADHVKVPGGLTGKLSGDIDAAVAEHGLHLGQRIRLLDLADEPGANIFTTLVVEIAGTLSRQKQPQSGRPARRNKCSIGSLLAGCLTAGR